MDCNLRWCEKLVLDAERLDIKVNISYTLKAVELLLLCNLVQDLEELLLDLGVVGSCLEGRTVVGGDSLAKNLAGKRREVLQIDTKDTDKSRLLGITVDKGHGNQVGVTQVDVLDTLGRDVFTLRQLEDVLLTVNNLETTQLVNFSNITSVEPPIGIDGLLGLLLVLVVLAEDTRATEKELTAGAGLSSTVYSNSGTDSKQISTQPVGGPMVPRPKSPGTWTVPTAYDSVKP